MAVIASSQRLYDGLVTGPMIEPIVSTAMQCYACEALRPPSFVFSYRVHPISGQQCNG